MREYSRSSYLELFWGKGALKICRKFTGERPCKSVIELLFGMGVLLYIKFAACIFSEHIFLRTPLDGCFWHRLLSTLSSCIWNRVNLHVVETEWEAKNFHKNFYDVLEKGVEIKRHITYFCNKSNYEWPLKSKWKNHEKALIETFFRFGDCFWAQGNRHPKN